jgi:hypothetical protein
MAGTSKYDIVSRFQRGNRGAVANRAIFQENKRIIQDRLPPYIELESLFFLRAQPPQLLDARSRPAYSTSAFPTGNSILLDCPFAHGDRPLAATSAVRGLHSYPPARNRSPQSHSSPCGHQCPRGHPSLRHRAPVREEYADSNDGMNFGIMEIETTFQGCCFAFGTRNTHDKSTSPPELQGGCRLDFVVSRHGAGTGVIDPAMKGEIAFCQPSRNRGM